MNRYPSAARALHQLERHGSGTPADIPPALRGWEENLAWFNAAASVSSARFIAGLEAFAASMRSKQETT